MIIALEDSTDELKINSCLLGDSKSKVFFYDINRYIYIYTYEEEIYIKKWRLWEYFSPLK